MGLTVSVFRSSMGDATMGGISGLADQLCLVNVDGPSNPYDNTPAALLIKGNVEGAVKIVPAVINGKGEYVPSPAWTMMGGNYAATSDSRFHRAVQAIIGKGACSYGAVPIHDRIE